jgi:exosortase D (VPLPA-CTERM-specific)
MTTASVYGDPKARYHASSLMTVALLVVVLAAAAICFRTGITALLQAWNKPEYSHGYIIPAIAIFLALVRSRSMPHHVSLDRGNPLPGLILLLCGVLLGAFGTLAAIPDIVTYGLLISVVGLIAAVIGVKPVFHLWPAWVYLLFMLPLPNFIYWPLSIKLQFLSSEVGVKLIEFMAIPVYLEGNIIDLGVYKLQVAEACSGLRYLFPLMSFGFLFAALYNGVWWQKVIIVFSTIPITIFMNSIRIGVIGILVNSYGQEQAEGFLHFFEGWVIFIVCIILLYIEAIVLMKLTASLQRGEGIFDLSMEGLGSEVKRWITYRATPPLFTSAVMLLLGALFWSLSPERAIATPERSRFDLFPTSLNGWTAKRLPLEPDIIRVLGADDFMFADFSKPGEAAPVNLLVSYYQSQTSGSGIHSPAVCIPAGGWEVSRWEQTSLSIGNGSQLTFEVNRAIIQKGESRQLVYYWFEQRGRRLTSDYVAKAYTVWDSAFRARSDGALVRVVTPIEGKNVAGAEQRLMGFLEATLPKLPDFVPP